MKETCLDLRSHFSQLVGYVEFGEQEIKFKFHPDAQNPARLQELAEFEMAVDSLELVTREIEIPAEVPRPKAEETVK